MTNEFKTEIVKTKEFKKAYSIVFGILYLTATFYIFLLDKENQNIYLKYIALLIYLFGAYFLFAQSFIKPKKIGVFSMYEDFIKFELNGVEKTIQLKELDNIFLKYTDYGSWTTHSIYGNKNYLKIINKNGEKYDFEILIRNKKMKDDFKAFINNTGIYEKFDFIKISNSRTEF